MKGILAQAMNSRAMQLKGVVHDGTY